MVRKIYTTLYGKSAQPKNKKPQNTELILHSIKTHTPGLGLVEWEVSE